MSGVTAAPSLTRLEARLLAALQQNKGACLSREFLLRTIWGYERETRTRTVDVHIRRLRRKLGPRGGSIQTVLRRGYFWAEEPPVIGSR